MNTQENQYLFKEKAYTEKKGELQAQKEILELEYSQKQFKSMYRENKEQKKLIEVLGKDIDKYKQTIFNLKFEKDTKNKKQRDVKLTSEPRGDILTLRRIINNLEPNKHYTRTDLAEELCTSIPVLDSCLKFIMDFNILKIKQHNDRVHFWREE